MTRFFLALSVELYPYRLLVYMDSSFYTRSQTKKQHHHQKQNKKVRNALSPCAPVFCCSEHAKKGTRARTQDNSGTCRPREPPPQKQNPGQSPTKRVRWFAAAAAAAGERPIGSKPTAARHASTLCARQLSLSTNKKGKKQNTTKTQKQKSGIPSKLPSRPYSACWAIQYPRLPPLVQSLPHTHTHTTQHGEIGGNKERLGKTKNKTKKNALGLQESPPI